MYKIWCLDLLPSAPWRKLTRTSVGLPAILVGMPLHIIMNIRIFGQGSEPPADPAAQTPSGY